MMGEAVYKEMMMIFPNVSGSNLLRQKMVLPQDFKGKLNLVFVPFLQWQQMEVDSWGAFIRRLEDEHEGLYYYELPTIQKRNSLYQMFINEGMRAGIPNPTTRERTITLYLDKSSFQQALEMGDEDHIYIMLVERAGNVIFRARGAFTPESGLQVEEAARQFFARPGA